MKPLHFEPRSDPIPKLDDLFSIAEELRENLGEWALLGHSPTAGAARQRAYSIRQGDHPSFGPPGAFEAQYAALFGEYRVYVRCVSVNG